jgi:hypothetical protein
MPDFDAGQMIHDAVEAARDLQRPELVTLHEPETGLRAPALIGPDGITGIEAALFDAYRTRPKRRQGAARLASLDSFIAHANRFKDEHSALFADDSPTVPSLQAVLDYHPGGGADEAEPRFGDHRGIYRFPLSPEWTTWTAHNGKRFGMVDFAAFLEDHIGDVEAVEPGALPDDMAKFVGAAGYQNAASPSRLIELSRGLSFNERNEVREVRNLQTGEAQFLFTTEHTDAAGAPLTVPNLFLLALPVFRQDGFYRLLARLRYRKDGPKITFHYDLWRPDRIFDDAFRRAAEAAREATDLPLFFGQPEA